MNGQSYRHILGLTATILFLGVQIGRAAPMGPYRFHSPSGRFDLVVETIPADAANSQSAKPGTVRASREQYAIYLYVTRSSEPVNVLTYVDADPPLPPEDIIHSMLWSPQEGFVLLPDKQKAREGGHIFQLAAPTSINKVWSLEADHPQWLDDHRFAGDLNTKQVPGGVMEFNGNTGKAELLIYASNGIGYQIAAVTGDRITVKEFLNHLDDGKTTWDVFVPSCFDLNVDTLEKSSVACPK